MVKPFKTTLRIFTAVALAATGGPAATHSSGGGLVVKEDDATEGLVQVKLLTWVNPFINIGTDGQDQIEKTVL